MERRKGGVYNVDPMLLDFNPEVDDGLPPAGHEHDPSAAAATAAAAPQHAEGGTPAPQGGSAESEGDRQPRDPAEQESRLRGRFPSRTDLERGETVRFDLSVFLESLPGTTGLLFRCPTGTAGLLLRRALRRLHPACTQALSCATTCFRPATSVASSSTQAHLCVPRQWHALCSAVAAAAAALAL